MSETFFVPVSIRLETLVEVEAYSKEEAADKVSKEFINANVIKEQVIEKDDYGIDGFTVDYDGVHTGEEEDAE